MPRRVRPLTAACAAAAVLVPSALAAPTPMEPTRIAPPFTKGTSVTLEWQAPTFSNYTVAHAQTVTVDDLTTGAHVSDRSVPVGTKSLTVSGLADGHEYRFTLRASERCAPARCGADAPAEPSAPRTQTTTMDATAPTGSVLVNGGDEFTRSRDVGLTVDGDDPAPAEGLASSGLSAMLLSHTGAFPPGDNGVRFEPMIATTLPDGPDGPRTVYVRLVDGATDWTRTALGNQSPLMTGTITLDRAAPSVALSLSTVANASGVHVTGTAVVADGTSGVADGTALWTFGDGGEPQQGLGATRTFTTPGVYAGTFSVEDRAGNVAETPFTVVVNAAVAAPQGTSVTGTPPAAGVAPATGAVIVTPPPAATATTTTPPAPTVTTSPAVTHVVRPKTPALRVTPLRPRSGRTLVVRVRTVQRGAVVATLTRTVKKRTSTVRRVRRVAGPGWVTLRMKAPAKGTYSLRVAAGGASAYRLVRVQR